MKNGDVLNALDLLETAQPAPTLVMYAQPARPDLFLTFSELLAFLTSLKETHFVFWLTF